MTPFAHASRSTPFPVPAALTALWLAGVVGASQSGLLGALGRTFMPGFALLVALGIGVPVALYFSWPTLRRAVDAIGVHRLTLMHIWRIPAALVFFWYGLHGELPALFWIVAGVGDFMAGAYASTLLWRTPTPALYRRIHVFGFTDFISAVGLGLTFTLLNDPRMVLLTTLPMALIPLFGVGLSGASHIIVLVRLRRERRNA